MIIMLMMIMMIKWGDLELEHSKTHNTDAYFVHDDNNDEGDDDND